MADNQVELCGDVIERARLVLRNADDAHDMAAEAREAHNSGHGEMVARYSEIIARSLSHSPEEIGDLSFAARVHDVGKIFVPERILNKPGPLTEDEHYLLKWHARVGGEILATLPEGKKLQEAVHHHHESFDGGGYPDGAYRAWPRAPHRSSCRRATRA